MLHDHDFPALHPEWVLRNDGRKVILYLMSNSEARYQILDPWTAVVVPFLDGQHTVTELTEIIRYVGSLPSTNQARSLLEGVVEDLNVGVEKIAMTDKPALWRVDYDPSDFIISPDNFASERRLAVPFTLLVYFSGWCQANCIYCYADLANMRRLEHLSLQQWLRIACEARELDIRIIQFTGGDTLGRPYSIDFVTHLIELRFLFLLSTKCYVSLADARRLVDAGFNEPVNSVHRDFQVSIDSPDPTVADCLVGCKGYLERATETVGNLIEAGIPARVKAVVTPFNYRQIRGQVETFAALGVRGLMFSLYARSHYRHDDSLFMSDEMKAETADVLSAIVEERPELTIEGDATRSVPDSQDDPRQKEKKWAARSGCSAGRTNLGIAPDGRAVLCEQMPLTEPYFVGDLTEQSILEVWNSPKLLDFIHPPRERFVGTPCYNCADFDHCVHDMGHCFRDSFFAYGKLHHPPPNCPRAPAGAPRMI